MREKGNRLPQLKVIQNFKRPTLHIRLQWLMYTLYDNYDYKVVV